MRIEELKSKLSYILNNTKSISLFLVLQDNSKISIKKADIDNGITTDELNKMFRDRLNEIISNDELSLINLSTADERCTAIYEYDYNEYPGKMSYINDFDIKQAVYYDNFSFSHDNLNSLIGYMIYIGDMTNGVVCFKKHYPISVIKRGTFLIHKCNERFEKMDTDDIIRLNSDISLFKLEDKIFIINVETIEKHLGFEELIRKRADTALSAIENKGIVEDMSELREASHDLSFSKKLSKIAGQSLIITKSIPNEKVIEFSRNHPGLKNKFTYNDVGNKIILKTKASKTAFLKLLNDDFLISELTNQSYDSLAKDRI